MKLPVIPTLIVGLAVAAMIGLGIWQLDRRAEKEAAIASYGGNSALPVMAFPRPPVGDEHLFRRATAMCLTVTGWSEQAGRAENGAKGWRHIADCRTGVEALTVKFDMGVSTAPGSTPVWKGGEVTGSITHAPDSTPLLAGLFGKRGPRALMLVADDPAPGLAASARPDPSSVPNNHLAYAVQWFLFAAAAAVIYFLALRWREKRATPPPADPS
ncbi:SURF1 family protein [Sphingomonas sp. MG17]|uniref:SURF1-like protein n=1 Tax=Sphingomonas tagetis TaxID=2949092 RepID=A0A9X2HQ28_9SPHN|nr:SURF1 family protein [Sphingomonas tagetis]MCP3732321.1 SURF1 family protein [Sphingomonas tagetis]